MYCSPVMRFCLWPDEEQEPAVQPPIWSILVYMLLVETLNIDDETLRQRLGLVVPIEDPDLGSKIDARGPRCPGRSTEVDETLSRSGKLNKARNFFSLILSRFVLVLTNLFRLHRA
jgi:hypothetical protein